MIGPRSIADAAGIVRLDEFLAFLSQHRRRLKVKRMARLSGLPPAAIYRAINGSNVNKKTLRALVSIFGGELLVVLKDGSNKLAVDENDKLT